MKKQFVVLTSVLILSACAKRPDAIVPVSIPMAAYTNLSCSQLSHTLVNEQTNLSALSAAQNSAATGDAVGVFLIGIPTSSAFGGDKEGEVAVSKGKVNAIKAAMANKSCPAV